MAASFLFFKPHHLPLVPGEMDQDSVGPLGSAADIKDALAAVFPVIDWRKDGMGATELDGNWMELHLLEDPGAKGMYTLSVRCSLRVDHGPTIQRLVDRLGWVAFDERPVMFQPGRPPVPV